MHECMPACTHTVPAAQMSSALVKKQLNSLVASQQHGQAAAKKGGAAAKAKKRALKAQQKKAQEALAVKSAAKTKRRNLRFFKQTLAADAAEQELMLSAVQAASKFKYK